MHARNVITPGLFVLIVAACSGANDGVPRTGLVAQQQSSASQQSNCGYGEFAPVQELVCNDLQLAPTTATINALPGGYWTGQFADETQVVQGYVAAMVSEDGRFQMHAYRYNENNLCTNWDAALAGTITTAANAMSGSGRLLAFAPTLADGTMASDLQIEGIIDERRNMIGKWTGASGDAGCFVMNFYNFYYEAPSALANLSGEWTEGGLSSAGTRLVVASDGSVSGTDNSGCNVTGYFALIDDQASLYEFEADFTSCARAGHYAGLALHSPGWDPGEFWLHVQASNNAQVLKLFFSSRRAQ